MISTDTVLFAVPMAKKPLAEAAPAVGLRTVFREFWPDTRLFRGRLLLSLAMVAIPPLFAAASIWMLKILIDDVLTPRNMSLFPTVAAAFVGLTAVEGLISFFDEYLNAWVGERFVLILRSRVFDHLQQLSLTFFQERPLGDILSRLTGDIGAIEQLMLSGLNQALTYLFQTVFFAGALFLLDWRLALTAFIATPGFLLLARFFSTRIKSASRERRRRSGSITAVAEESLHNIALVQAYNQQARESARFRKESLGSFTAQMLATKLEALFAPFTDLLQLIGVLMVVGFGIRELVAGRVTLGGLLVFLGYLSQLYGPISGVGNLVNSIYSASAGAERIFEVLDAKPEVLNPADPVPMRRVHGALTVDRLGFSYPGSGRPTLAEVSFSAAPGETIAVVGASGAGKSTLLRLLLRLHDPFRGSVSLDGVDIRRMSMADLRANVAVVLQETLVFDGTVAENIRWGQPNATEAEVTAAARAADAHQFITGLPNGYRTRIGQRGMMLSGGQRQRIALARAMIRDAPVLLLDEPTTGLDAAAAQRVLAPLRRAMGGQTTVVISHNLLTVTDADRILYLEQGRVAGYGTHQELLARSPGYARLYRLHHPATGDMVLPPIPPRGRPRPRQPPRAENHPPPPGPRPRPRPAGAPSPTPRSVPTGPRPAGVPSPTPRGPRRPPAIGAPPTQAALGRPGVRPTPSPAPRPPAQPGAPRPSGPSPVIGQPVAERPDVVPPPLPEPARGIANGVPRAAPEPPPTRRREPAPAEPFRRDEPFSAPGPSSASVPPMPTMPVPPSVPAPPLDGPFWPAWATERPESDHIPPNGVPISRDRSAPQPLPGTRRTTPKPIPQTRLPAIPIPRSSLPERT